MNIVDRVKNLLVTPQTEWPVIGGEPATTSSLVTGYVLPLAGISAAAGFIGNAIVGTMLWGGVYRMGVTTAFLIAVWSVAMAVAGCFIVGFIINALAPTFRAQKNDLQSFKVAAYTMTPVWVAGILHIIPFLGILTILGVIYAIYLLYLGLQIVMKSPADQAAGYTAAAAIIGFVVMFVISAIGGAFIGVGSIVADVR